MFPIAAVVLSSLLLAAPSSAKLGAEEWIREAVVPPWWREIPSNSLVYWRTIVESNLSHEQFEQLRKETENQPDHPKRMQWELASELALGAKVTDHELWFENPQIWRLCSTTTNGVGRSSYVDIGMNETDIWSLVPSQLNIGSASVSAGESKMLADTFASTCSAGLGYLVGDGLANLRLKNAALESVKETGSLQWMAVAAIQNGKRRIAFHEVSTDGFVVDRVEAAGTADSPAVVTWRFGGRKRFLPECEGYQVVEMAGSGIATKERYELLGIKAAGSEEIHAMARTPVGGTDTVRGNIHVTNVADLRTNRMQVNRPNLPASISPDGSSSSGKLWAMWSAGIAGVVVGALLLLQRFRK